MAVDNKQGKTKKSKSGRTRNKHPIILWTEMQREIADLAGQGKTFTEIVAGGFTKNMVFRVLQALKDGQRPELELQNVELGNQEKPEPQAGETEPKPEKPEPKGEGKPMVTVVGPKTAPIVFRVEQKQIVLDPLELNKQYSYYLDIAKRDGGISNSFSQVLTLSMQVLWVLLQDIPTDENMLKAIFYGAK